MPFLRGRSKNKRSPYNEPLSEIDAEEIIEQLGLYEPEEKPISRSVKPSEMNMSSNSIYIKPHKLTGLADVPFIVEELDRGNIILLDISKFNDGREQSRLELRRVVERLRGETRGIQSEMALIGKDYIVVTPRYVKIASS